MAAERARRSSRMDQPLDRSRSLRPSVDTERFGALSETVARRIGSWAFIAWMTAFIIAWVAINIVIGALLLLQVMRLMRGRELNASKS